MLLPTASSSLQGIKNNTAQIQPTDVTASTKGRVLATTASILDPLGLLSPFVIVYKIFLQKMWQDQLQWEELLPAHLQKRMNSAASDYL